MALGLLVNKVLFDVRLIERALHGTSTWTAHWAGMASPVAIQVNEDSIIFEAEFRDFCLLGDPQPVVEIQVDGDPVAWREITHPGDGGFIFRWTFTLAADLVAA